MDNVSIKVLDDRSVIVFRGALNINHIVSLKQEIEDLITFEHDLEVQIDAAESVDITFIQLIVALKNSCQAKKSNFTIKGQLSEDILGLMRNAGLEKILNN